MKILFIGDVFARPGRQALNLWLKDLISEHDIDFCIANGENAAHGNGITKQTADEIYASGVDFITLGNHAWGQKDTLSFIDDFPIVRPANMSKSLPGKGWCIVNTNKGYIGILNLQGRVFMDHVDNPFECATECLHEMRQYTNIIVVDFHAEATSEKIALALYIDGLCSCVIGTHTHVQTADERILPNGTAFISDAGMTGPIHSIIGMDIKCVMEKFVRSMPTRFEPAKGSFMLNAVVIDICDNSGVAKDIYRIFLKQS